ncbi:MAG: globin [Burkholderiales bacterium]
MRAQAIEASLEAVAARVGNPAPQVYARLFQHAPALRALFVRDTDGSVRGQMLQQVFETVLDLVEGNHYGGTLIASEWVNHQNLGVPAGQFELFFTAMIEAFRDILGDDWTPAFDEAWASVTAQVADIVAQRARAAPA